MHAFLPLVIGDNKISPNYLKIHGGILKKYTNR